MEYIGCQPPKCKTSANRKFTLLSLTIWRGLRLGDTVIECNSDYGPMMESGRNNRNDYMSELIVTVPPYASLGCKRQHTGHPQKSLTFACIFSHVESHVFKVIHFG